MGGCGARGAHSEAGQALGSVDFAVGREGGRAARGGTRRLRGWRVERARRARPRQAGVARAARPSRLGERTRARTRVAGDRVPTVRAGRWEGDRVSGRLRRRLFVSCFFVLLSCVFYDRLELKVARQRFDRE